MKVLVVDDTPENVYLLESLLKGHGYDVSTAENGLEALEKLKQDPATLIISDILMPKMDGFQLCRAVKADDALKNIPFIFYTATYTTEKDRDFALSLGASRFILKPTDPGEFIGIIKEVLVEKGIGLLQPGIVEIEKETEYLKEHQERLIKKLGDKITELERLEERYRSLINGAIDAIITLDESGAITYWNKAAEKTLGYASDEVIGKPFSMLIPEGFRPQQEAVLEGLKKKKLPAHLEAVVRSKRADLIAVEASFSLMTDKQGKVLGFSAIIRDMTERMRAEAVLQKNRRLLAETEQMGKVGGWEVDIDTRKMIWTEEIYRIHEMDFYYQPKMDEGINFYTPASRPIIERALQRAIEQGEPFDVELEIITAKGNLRSVHAIGKADLGNRRIYGFFQDITERKRMEAKLYETQELLSLFIRHSPIYAFIKQVTSTESRVLQASDNFQQMVGIPGPEMAGKTMAELFPPDFAEKITADDWAVVTRGEVLKLDEDLNGRNYITIKFPIVQGDKTMLAGYTIDITDRKRAEEALKNSEKFIEDILASVDEAFVVVDREYRILTANRAYCEQTGESLDHIIGKHCYEISHHATEPCHAPENVCGCKRTFETGEPTTVIHTHTDDKGGQRHVEIRTFAMKDESGGVRSIIEVINDITEKRALENQLRHAQKMESIGTLAGGIAHDFNNILSAIIGYGHITLMKMQKDDPLRMNIEHMLESADRAAALTQSLLTFSRKQVSERKPVDLNAIIRKVEKFLARVIGEDVAVRLALAEGVLTIFADAGQLEQVFMNLATNARDAMPYGGSFTIETAVTELDYGYIAAHGYGKPGNYAMINATDTGVGMNEETRKKIFEPFFTTKEVGKGTGLGLAMVYGIIKQNEGFINVYSEPGRGTTFRIYLPLIKSAVVDEKITPETAHPTCGTETILLAEDDPSLRKLSVYILEQAGYTVITANDGEEAVTKFNENKDRIRLLLFDMIMPKKGGKEAFDEIRRMYPAVPVLFASGYSPDMLRQKSLIENGAVVVFKPISPQKLLEKVREVLDRKQPSVQ